MGTSPEVLDQMTRLIERDRNHPCVVIWSIGNEEWTVEGNEKGTRITETMQRLARRLDPPMAIVSFAVRRSHSPRPRVFLGRHFMLARAHASTEVLFEQPSLDGVAGEHFLVPVAVHKPPTDGVFHMILWQPNPNRTDGMLVPVDWNAGEKTGFYPARSRSGHASRPVSVTGREFPRCRSTEIR